jgi:hypothetical protein
VSEHLIDPLRGEFDTHAIDVYLQAVKYSARDPHWSNTFLLSADEESLEDYVEQRRAHPDEFPPSSIRVNVNPQRIRVICHTQLNAPARQFVKWLRERYDLRFLDDEFNDLTENVDPDLNYLFGTPP